VVGTFWKPLLSLADRIWNLGQSLWILALPLIVLKLTGVIAWSWWWVLAPLWIIGIVVLPFLCLLVAGTCWDKRSRWLFGEYQDEEYGEPRLGGLAGGWPREVSLGRFRRSGTFPATLTARQDRGYRSRASRPKSVSCMNACHGVALRGVLPLPLSRKTLTFVTGIIRRHRKAIGSR
jgi:hypothetical protein